MLTMAVPVLESVKAARFRFSEGRSSSLAATFEAVRWSLGNLTQAGYAGVKLLVPVAVVCCATLLAQTRALESMLGGEERAHAQGVNIRPTRRILFPVSALGWAAFLVLSDALGRWWMPTADLPIGVVTASVGAPLLTWLGPGGEAEPRGPLASGLWRVAVQGRRSSQMRAASNKFPGFRMPEALSRQDR